MHIYIYGSASFKETVHKALDHANVKFRMDESGTIEDIDSLEALKLAIEAEPENIYLIDNDKIIDEKAINSKIKFLKPKDGIEKKFLDDHGIEDVSINSIEELPKYVIKKLESMHLTDIFDDEDHKIDNSKQENDATVSQNEIEEINNILDDIENQDSDDEDDDFDLDDDLKGLLSHDEDEISNNDEEIIEIEYDGENQEKEKDELENIDDMHTLMDINLEPPEELLQELPTHNNPQGEKNMDDLTQLDQLQENDLKAALDGLDISDFNVPQQKTATPESSPSAPKVTSNDSIQIDSSNVADLQALIMQLLNNKTLEITVKIKE